MKTDNEKIAEFMGSVPSYDYGLCGWKTYWINYNDPEPIDARNMQYHTSWDWLMPVVEKIKQLRDFDTVTDGKHNRDPYFATRVADLLGILTTVDIKVVHLAVVQFIDWYNENTSQTLKK